MDFYLIKECFKYFLIVFVIFVFIVGVLDAIITCLYHFKLISIFKSKRKQNLPMSYYVDEFEIEDDFLRWLRHSYSIDDTVNDILTDKFFYNKYFRKAGFSQSQIDEFNSLFDKKNMEVLH
ncbi:hypothetical protein [Candidatus Phytoplasma pini]|uniref:Uncharacterized protein n=1 Tax=Candidatus Phytoplasma pini TaxID=267362 RepID=A0A559KJ05_9MOLU|nr:hypothetical protein [Candidatus Phytoplasma pini]TVY12089.1 hypothetical protein MDPP_00376 [Candidatus Phytoplasma pini]